MREDHKARDMMALLLKLQRKARDQLTNAGKTDTSYLSGQELLQHQLRMNTLRTQCESMKIAVDEAKKVMNVKYAIMVPFEGEWIYVTNAPYDYDHLEPITWSTREDAENATWGWKTYRIVKYYEN